MAPKGCPYGAYDPLRVSDFDNQLIKPLIMQLNYDGMRWVVHIPKQPLSILIKRAGSDDAREIGTRQAQARMIGVDGRVVIDATNMCERDGQLMGERPLLRGGRTGRSRHTVLLARSLPAITAQTHAHPAAGRSAHYARAR